MSTDTTVGPAASPKPAALLMGLTYAFGVVGIFVAFTTLNWQPASLSLAAVITVGGAGGLSFLRHSVFHRSDAVRMGWDTGQRNNFQIEVGLANLAWAVLAVLSVIFRWGLAAEAASFLVFGIYLLACAAMLLASHRLGSSRPWGPIIAMAVFGGLLSAVGVLGMQAA